MSASPNTKNCPKCNLLKPFARNAGRADGLAVWCKDCMSEYQREWRARPNVRARMADLALARYHALPDPEKAARNRRRTLTGARLEKMYGLTIDQDEQLLASQGGGCAICGREPKTYRLSVDHDHRCCPGQKTCGRCIRGLLCNACNRALGWLDNAEWMASASRYVQREIDRIIADGKETAARPSNG